MMLDPINQIAELNNETISYGRVMELNDLTRIKRDRKDHFIIETEDFELDVTLVRVLLIIP